MNLPVVFFRSTRTGARQKDAAVSTWSTEHHLMLKSTLYTIIQRYYNTDDKTCMVVTRLWKIMGIVLLPHSLIILFPDEIIKNAVHIFC